VRELAARAPEALAEAAAASEIKDLNRGLPDHLIDVVAKRAERCIKLLDSGALAAASSS